VIIAGTPFYAGFGFVYEPKSITEYQELIYKAVDLPRLSRDQVRQALHVFEIWENIFDWNNPIITTELLASVWGSGVERDLGRAYRILTKNLSNTDPRQTKLWQFASRVENNV
jgi:type II secretory pathway component PulJ